jgi:hypothetical protein
VKKTRMIGPRNDYDDDGSEMRVDREMYYLLGRNSMFLSRIII